MVGTNLETNLWPVMVGTNPGTDLGLAGSWRVVGTNLRWWAMVGTNLETNLGLAGRWRVAGDDRDQPRYQPRAG
jgi:hypothetical protein